MGKEAKTVTISYIAEKVDDEYDTKFRHILLSKHFGAKNHAKIVLFAFLIAIYVVGVILLSQIIHLLPFSFSQGNAVNDVANLTAIVATFIALISFLISIFGVVKIEDNDAILTNYNYNKILEKYPFSDDNKPWLKALIILKTRQPELKLTDLFYPIDVTLTEKELREVLFGFRQDRSK